MSTRKACRSARSENLGWLSAGGGISTTSRHLVSNVSSISGTISRWRSTIGRTVTTPAVLPCKEQTANSSLPPTAVERRPDLRGEPDRKELREHADRRFGRGTLQLTSSYNVELARPRILRQPFRALALLPRSVTTHTQSTRHKVSRLPQKGVHDDRACEHHYRTIYREDT